MAATTVIWGQPAPIPQPSQDVLLKACRNAPSLARPCTGLSKSSCCSLVSSPTVITAQTYKAASERAQMMLAHKRPWTSVDLCS